MPAEASSGTGSPSKGMRPTTSSGMGSSLQPAPSLSSTNAGTRGGGSSNSAARLRPSR